MDNPWRDIVATEKIKIIKDDEVFLNDYILECSKPSENNLNKDSLNQWPEPYIGNPKAPVYLLKGNPGYCNLDHLFTEDPVFVDIMKRNLKHDELDNLNDFVYFNTLQTRGLVHGGCQWWMNKTKALRETLEGSHPFIFDLEYSPFHSKNGVMPDPNQLMQTKAYQYSNYLLKLALESDKILILMRKQGLWMDRLKQIASKNNLTLNKERIMKLSRTRQQTANRVCHDTPCVSCGRYETHADSRKGRFCQRAVFLSQFQESSGYDS